MYIILSTGEEGYLLVSYSFQGGYVQEQWVCPRGWVCLGIGMSREADMGLKWVGSHTPFSPDMGYHGTMDGNTDDTPSTGIVSCEWLFYPHCSYLMGKTNLKTLIYLALSDSAKKQEAINAITDGSTDGRTDVSTVEAGNARLDTFFTKCTNLNCGLTVKKYK